MALAGVLRAVFSRYRLHPEELRFCQDSIATDLLFFIYKFIILSILHPDRTLPSLPSSQCISQLPSPPDTLLPFRKQQTSFLAMSPENCIKTCSKTGHNPPYQSGTRKPIWGKWFWEQAKESETLPFPFLGVQHQPQAKQPQCVCKGPNADTCILRSCYLISLWAPAGPYEPWLVDSVGWTMFSWCPLALPSPLLWGFLNSVCLCGHGSLYLLPSTSGGSLCHEVWDQHWFYGYSKLDG